MIIVTFISSLKGMSKDGQYKGSKQCYCVSSMLFVNTVDKKIKASNALNAMFFETVDTGVCGSYTTLYREYCEV